MNTPKDQQSKAIKGNECLDTSISFQELEDLAWQPSNLGEYRRAIRLVVNHGNQPVNSH